MLSKTKTEPTLILRIQSNIRKQERDSKTENPLSEADKGKRVTKRSLSVRLMSRTREYRNLKKVNQDLRHKMTPCSIKTTSSKSKCPTFRRTWPTQAWSEE